MACKTQSEFCVPESTNCVSGSHPILRWQRFLIRWSFHRADDLLRRAPGDPGSQEELCHPSIEWLPQAQIMIMFSASQGKEDQWMNELIIETIRAKYSKVPLIPHFGIYVIGDEWMDSSALGRHRKQHRNSAWSHDALGICLSPTWSIADVMSDWLISVRIKPLSNRWIHESIEQWFEEWFMNWASLQLVRRRSYLFSRSNK